MVEAKMFWARWVLLSTVLLLLIRQSLSQPLEHNASTKATSNNPRIFSPRMDYDEWTPLGRGDPLKNDPTFDYVPPVLDRVQYWLDSQSSTEASSKRDILVLGVTAKKTSPKIPDHFLKFVDGPKFTRNNNNNNNHHIHQQDNEDSYRKDYMGNAGVEPPKIIRASNFRNGVGIGINPQDFRNQNRVQNIPASYYPSPFYNGNSKPYTMMMPPPIQQSDVRQQLHQYGMQTEEPPTSILLNHDENRDPNPVAPRPFHSHSISNSHEPSTSLSSITLDKSNLVYQSSQTFDRWSATSDNNLSGQSIIWNSNDDIKSYDHYGDDHNSAASANHEVVIGQNANIIVDGDNVNNEQVVIGQKEIIPSLHNNSDDGQNNHIEANKMHIVIANTSSTLSNDIGKNKASQRITVAVVMPSNYVSPKNELEYSANETTSESTTPASTASVRVLPSKQSLTMTTQTRIVPRLPVPTPVKNSGQRPIQNFPSIPDFSSTTIKMQGGEFISSMIPPKAPVPSAMAFQHFTTSGMNQRHQNVKQEMTRPLMAESEKIVGNQSPLAIILNSEEMKKTISSLNSDTTLTPSTSMTTSAAPMTTVPTLRSTTELIFSNHKQPPKSVHTPMYLIIQGHSKVKTYKPTMNKYGVPVEKNLIDVESTTKRFISKFEQFVNDNTRVVSTTRRSITENNHEVKAKEKRVEQDSLLSLVESGLSAFVASPLPSSSSSAPFLSSSLFK